VCRRAERHVVRLARTDDIGNEATIYLEPSVGPSLCLPGLPITPPAYRGS
jgi:hypothetical protein